MEKSLASNDGEYQLTDVVALSGLVIVAQQRFLSGIVIKRRNGIAQAIQMGDIIAIANESNKKNYFPGRWSLAQVLGFQGTDSVMVLHLRHVKEISKEISNAKFVKEYVRIDNSLAVSRSVETNIAVDRILPISVRLLSHKVYRHGDYLKLICGELIEEWNFQCHFLLPVTLDGSHPAVELDPTYLQPTQKNRLPESVVEAFKLLNIPNIDSNSVGQRLTANYKYTDAARFQMSQSLQVENSPPPKEVTKQTMKKETRKRGALEETPPAKNKKRAKNTQTAQPAKKRSAPNDHKRQNAPRPKPKTSFHVALGPVCFQKRTKDSLMSFYDNMTLEKKWKVTVGSLAKVNYADRCEAPAQVLSIYREKDAGHVVLEVRWFYQVGELPPQVELPDDLNRTEIIEVDEDVSHVKPANLVGPLRLTSNPKKQTKKTLLCRYYFSMRQFSFSSAETLSPITHWSGQDYSRIGLDCPKAFPGRFPDLLQAYGGSEVGSAVISGCRHHKWSKYELNRDANVAPGTLIVQTPNGTEYFEYIEWRPLAERYAAKSAVKRLCKARIGDTVCLMSQEDSVCEPFVGPWQLVQILAIYRARGESCLQLEVRLCRRFADLPESVKEWAPELKSNQFFESDIVKRNVLASHVLAPTRLLFKKQQQRSFDDSVVCVHCPYFYVSEKMYIQSLVSYEDESLQKSWFVQRGIRKSALVNEERDLKNGLQFCMILPHDNINVDHGLSPILPECFSVEQVATTSSVVKSMVVSCSLRPQWQKILDSSNLLPVSNQTRWICRIGDLVAVEREVKNEDGLNQTTPFTVAWVAAQVVALKRDAGNNEAVKVQLRPIGMKAKRRACYQLEVCTRATATWRDTSVLLGPLFVVPPFSNIETAGRKITWGWWYPFLPTINVVYDDVEGLAGLFENGIFPPLDSGGLERVVRALVESNDFTSEGVQLPLLCAFDRLAGKLKRNNESHSLPRKSKVKTVGEAFYKDLKSQYYRAISVEVPPTLFTRILPKKDVSKKSKNVVWTANVGDPVVLFYDLPKSRSTPYLYRSSRDGIDHKFGPFLVPTAIGEIVTIRKENTNMIILEIRWFLRESEVGASDEGSHMCEEVVETDWFDENINADNLIAPVKLHDGKRELECDKRLDGLPLLEFFCFRFWSAIRKCSFPVAGLEGRIARGRLKSKRIAGNAALGRTLNDLQDCEINETTSKTCDMNRIESGMHAPWTTAFERTIGKLSLTDASRETDGNLTAIVGREEERRKISSFIQDALSGFRDSGKRPSLFVAGPPGTGKTATIRAVIRDLQSKLASSRSKQMRFIILNGMETRHPHDIYSMFWDELKTNEVAPVSTKRAAANLKKYFTAKTTPNHVNELIVVMLDEIDYVVTKSQEVLYDMFDLPLLSMENKPGRQLIMIGVSNMLNLPDKLHPRVQSRIGGAKVFFKSYSVEETKAILRSKLEAASPNYDVFHEDAILYASKKTAAMSGDIRKAFHMCKQAAELVVENAKKRASIDEYPKVCIKDVLQVSRDSFNSAQSRMVALSSPFEALLIITLASLSKTTGREFGGFDVEELVMKMASVANAAGDKQYLPPPSLDETLTLLRNMGASNLINLDSPQNMSLSYRSALAGSGGAWPLVSLPVDDVAVIVALKESPHYRLAQKHLGRQ